MDKRICPVCGADLEGPSRKHSWYCPTPPPEPGEPANPPETCDVIYIRYKPWNMSEELEIQEIARQAVAEA